ncbi:RDD family protein [Roseibacterium beibuensis]|uniref:RDD family protein n=1 Tax=[Roseibacterium] beibuensis TaxID=1193142 RepID=UPI00217DC34C|nr:RDD family protein [Roseibacterium beibuensis]MCS6622576.1 RDD family protein [Roseibacterium beibuensis]
MTAVDMTAGERKRQRVLVTPEGLELRLEIASVGQRLGALIIDMLIIGGVTLAAIIVLLLTASAIGERAGELVAVVFFLGMFLLRNGYFLAYEMSAKAATPGKRVLGLRVAARDGGRLRFDAVFTRNALRELELFLPLSLLVSAPFAGNVGGWIYVLTLIWCAVFVFLPVFNADRLRAGDLVAGTWVLRAPRQKLLRDMADDGALHRTAFGFTPAQLDVYGVKELQVLEQVLRTGDRPTVRAVADRISAKIGYDRGMAADSEFLRAYYHGVRERLESRLLMGRRRKDKFDAA